MKSSIWIGLLGISAVTALAWVMYQSNDARAIPPSTPAAGQAVASPAPALTETGYTDAGFNEAETGLSPSARVGREIWFKATAGNARFHTYSFQQRITALIDWYGVLRGDQRDTRFKSWGMINAPGCCTPAYWGYFLYDRKAKPH